MDTERLIKDASLMRELLHQITNKVYSHKQSELTAHFLFEFCVENDVELSSFVVPSPAGWWEFNEDNVLRQWLAGEVSEGHVAYVLGADRISCRIRAEKFAQEHGLEDNRWG